ncbi:MAG: hypothetical protein ACFCVK_16825 [Acidimicrobiales bacterium]
MNGHQLDPIELLGRANPVPLEHTEPGTSPGANRRFQEIIMHQPVSGADRDAAPITLDALRASERRRGRERRWAVRTVTAAAAALVVAAGAALVWPTSTPPAAAAMVQAAEQTGMANSGTVLISGHLGMDGVDERVDLIGRYDGDDVSLALTSGPAGIADGAYEARVVDGVLYTRADDDWYRIDDPKIDSVLTMVGSPLDVKTQVSEALIEIATTAENAREVAPGHFTATTTVGRLRTLIPTVPMAGVDAAVGEELPPKVAAQRVAVDLVLDADGNIDVVTFTADDLTDEAGATISADLVVDFESLGGGEAIEAPASAEPLEFDR